jgi:general stress protein 26
MNRAIAIGKLASLIDGVQVAMLTTVSEDGQLRSRPMAAQKVPLGDELLFLAADQSAKVNEIRQDHHVGLTYIAQSMFLTVSGRCRVSNDRALIKTLWMPIFAARFPGGVDDPQIRVLHVQLDAAEYWVTTPDGPAHNERLLP